MVVGVASFKRLPIWMARLIEPQQRRTQSDQSAERAQIAPR
jgi:hypothetical protein